VKDPQEIHRLLQEYEASALTQREFAVQAGVAFSTFTYWLRKFRAGAFQDLQPKWIEAPALASQGPAESGADFVLEWPNGVRLHLARGFDQDDAARLMELAAHSCSR
jgi:hypothetical protein